MLKYNFNVSVNLERIFLNGNPLEGIESNWFWNNTLLRYLNMIDCGIVNIDGSKLSHLNNLQHLDLSSNKIENFAPGTFDSLVKLDTLALNWNNLKRLNSNAFDKLSALESLYIESNQIDEIEQDFFDKFPIFKNIDARNNTCINEQFSGVAGYFQPFLRYFKVCFDNWTSPRITTSTTTAGASTVNITVLTVAFAAFMRLL